MRWANNWTLYDFEMLEMSEQPRVIVFRPGPNKKSLGSVRVVEGSPQRGILWDVFTSKDSKADGLYTGVIPAGFYCHLLCVEVRIYAYLN